MNKGDENDNNFKSKFLSDAEIAKEKLGDKDILPVVEIDAEVKLDDVNWKLFDELEKFIPYGEGNPKPKFLAKAISVTEAQTVGKEGKHMRLMVKQDSLTIRKTIGFCFGDWCAKLKAGDKIDMVFEVDVNEWNGNRELQLKIIDLKNG